MNTISEEEFKKINKPRKKPSHNESELQQGCLTWFRRQYPALAMNFFAISNEGARTKRNGARLKAQGMLAGTADMFLAVGCKSKALGDMYVDYGLFIEFKWGKNKQSESQKDFQKAVENHFYRYELIYDFDSVVNLINEYLK